MNRSYTSNKTGVDSGTSLCVSESAQCDSSSVDNQPQTLDNESQALLQELQQKQRKACLKACVQLLSYREHSQFELRRKLRERGHEPADIELAIDECHAQNWQSQRRFAEVFIRSKAAKGYGPSYIAQQLSAQHRLMNVDIQWGMDECDCDWFELCKSRYQKERRKFAANTLSFQQQQKLRGRLSRRGFSHEQIKYAQD
ncbi:regulatory protein RecX [Paraferrimonas haliotis]|uniref:Regulatory protein RecX n=1 Tax=Paraferrimonas haliotis TaxID=2013866 RepID=A0AA37WW16_9GAMM|nr:regulatory protein RecX [Paraferrimonas haliotis]GLS82802.1 hypothetical protein GCM10007894_07790 [Paraferrimonas haliotis]